MKKVKEIMAYLIQHDLMLAIAESCTGGELVRLLTQQENCSQCLSIGIVAYSALAKKKHLQVKQHTIDAYSLTSEKVAQEMAQGLFQNLEINVGIATTGIAGNKPIDGISPGTVCFAWAFKPSKKIIIFTETKKFEGSRAVIIKKAAKYALFKIKSLHQSL